VSRALVIVNPAAGRGRAAHSWARVTRHVRVSSDVECVTTSAPGHARELARDAARRGVPRVVAVGGDGTVSEVANGLAGTEVTLGVVPAGTGNDFSRALGLPTAPEQAFSLALERPPRAVDLGHLRVGQGTAWFVNVAGCGFDAEVLRRIAGAARLPGALAYFTGILRTLIALRPRPMRLTIDGRAVERRAVGMAVANGPRYGGGMLIAPRAVIDDGLFEVCVVGAINAIQLLALLPSLYAGTHGRHAAVEFFRCREVAVDGDAVECQADGELLGALPASFSIRPRALLCATGNVA
jgi:diacylglycerol kinase (ATP)